MPREEEKIMESTANVFLGICSDFLNNTCMFFNRFCILEFLPSKLTPGFCSALQQGVPQATNTLFCLCGASHLLSYLLKQLLAVDLVPLCRNGGGVVQADLFLGKKSLLSLLLNICCITLPRVLLLLLGCSVLDCWLFPMQCLAGVPVPSSSRALLHPVPCLPSEQLPFTSEGSRQQRLLLHFFLDIWPPWTPRPTRTSSKF